MSNASDRYAIIGHPVEHSLSPGIHAAFARQTGQRLEYARIDAPLRGFTAALRGFLAGGGKGLSVTLPFKEQAFKLCHELTPRAKKARAINTIVVKDDANLLGDNTDGAGLVRDLCDNLGVVITNRRMLIIGAGGATRGILAPLLGLEPTAVVIANRTPERAAALAAAFTDLGVTQGVGFEDIVPEPFDVIVNATSASLSGDIPPIPAAAIGPDSVCYDLAYGRAASAFVQWATRLGCARAEQGLGMLVEQAAESFRLWRGVRPATPQVLAALRERAG